MKPLALKLFLLLLTLCFSAGIAYFFSRPPVSEKKVEQLEGCPTAQDCAGSVAFGTCKCPDGNCGGCLRLRGERGCGKCSRCKIK